jgi:geranylgeranyl pyrophosphate synthase
MALEKPKLTEKKKKRERRILIEEKDSVHYEIPKTEDERTRLRLLIRREVAAHPAVPPLSMSALMEFATSLIAAHQLPESYEEWLMVELHNWVWMPFVSSIPFERRLLLLPQCLRHSGSCQAEIDEVGLVCHRCSPCSIPDLEDYAAHLGMMSLVAEGFTSVVELIKNGLVDCVIGVSCLDSLEKAFPLLIGNAVPGIAVPLNFDGCKDTEVDEHYVRLLMSQRSHEDVFLLDYAGLKSKVDAWFHKDALTNYLPNDGHSTLDTALQWMSASGKRWRPYLVAATYCALRSDDTITEEVKRAAMSVECFHKASLVHDDIQDNDQQRNGMPTVHAQHGVPIAINVGDALLGEGYQLLAETGNVLLIRAITDAHVALCKGQGMELEASRERRILSMDFVLDVFRLKTAPAFEVSLLMGLICAGDDEDLRRVFHRYSEALGIAYQLQDDLSDFHAEEDGSFELSAIKAAMAELPADMGLEERLKIARQRVQDLADEYHREALASLEHIQNVELKRLLFRVTHKILKGK